MQLPIEQWATEAHLPSEAADALREAAVCYRAGAYRAALLFSYVTWGLILRSRILAGKCPPGFPAAKWTSLQTAMTNEDRWDGEVFDSSQTQTPAPIFKVADDLRTQVRYWKDRRNDCAHSKRNSIVAAHVESLWEFLRSNIDKFQVGGSVEDLLERIRDHFDPNLTPPDGSRDGLARAIATSVPAGRRREFFDSAANLFKRTLLTPAHWAPDAPRFFDAVLRVGTEGVVDAAARLLLENISVLADLLLAFPQHSHILKDAPE